MLSLAAERLGQVIVDSPTVGGTTICIGRDVEFAAANLDGEEIRRDRSALRPVALAPLIEVQLVNELVGVGNLTAGVQIAAVVDRPEHFARAVPELLLEVLAVGPGGEVDDLIQRPTDDVVLSADSPLGVEGSDRGDGDARQQDKQWPAEAE